MNSVRDYIANRMNKNPELDDEDDSPYDSLARAGAQISDEEGPVNLEEDEITTSQPSPMVPPSPGTSAPSGLLDDYNRQEAASRGIRGQAREQNANVNISRGLAQLAGAAGTSPVKTDLYDSMIKQNDADASASASDLKNRAAVMRAVQQAQLRQSALQSTNDRQDKKIAADSANKQASLDAYKDRTKAIQGAQGSKQDNSNIRAANTIMKDPNVSRETNKLNAARSAQTLIDEIKAGKLVDSKNIRNQLTNIMATIEMGGPGAHADRAAMGVDNLYTKMQDALSFMESKPNSTLRGPVLEQLEHEANALGDRAAKNYKSLTDAALSGADLSGGDPEADHGKVYRLAKQRQTEFLRGNGYDPDSGQSKRAPVSDKPSPGSIVNVKGTRYRVGADGDSLEPI